MVPKYTADYNSFIFHHIQQLSSDAFIATKDLHQEFTSIKLDIRRRFPQRVANQLLERTQTFLTSQRRMLKKRGLAKLNVLCRKFSGSRFLSRYGNVSAIQCQLNDFSRLYSEAHNFDRFYSGLSYYSNPHYCDNNFDNFVDDNLADFDESVNFFNFSVDIAPHVTLSQPFKALHQENSQSSNNRHFDKQQRKPSYRRNSHESDRLHPMHHPIDLSSRTDTPINEINLLSKGQSFCTIPRDINWHKCQQDWQAFVDKMRWADFHFHCEHIDIANTSDLGPFKFKSHMRAPVSKDIALETFLAPVENMLFDANRASHEPKSSISKAENKVFCQLRSSKDFEVKLQYKGSRFVILDRYDYMDKVEPNLNDGSFDILGSDPSLSYYHIVKDWGDKWLEKGEITQPVVDCILMSMRGQLRTMI